MTGQSSRELIPLLLAQDPGLTDAEMAARLGLNTTTVWEMRRRLEAEGKLEPRESRIGLMRATEIEPRNLPILWRRRIPANTLTVIAGPPGLGKSTLGTLIAAELSTKGITGIICNLEDDPEAVIRPRLDVAGANLDLIHVVPHSSAPVLPRDVDELKAAIEATNAKYLILDPLSAHFNPERRVHDRPTLRQVWQLSRLTNCAIIGLHHTVKHALDGHAISALGGPAGGLGGTARAVYLYGHDPEDEDRRALVCAKINGIDEPPALVLEHETVEYNVGGRIVEAGLLAVADETVISPKRVLRRGKAHGKRDGDCEEWLSLYLASGDDCKRQVSEIRSEGAQHGFGYSTLRRVATSLRLERPRIGFGADSFVLWRLPDDHPLRDAAVQEPEEVHDE